MRVDPGHTIGIFGGTFDPPHAGHLALARSVLLSNAVDILYLVPCVTHALGKTPIDFRHRLAMCRLLIAKQPGMIVSDIEKTLSHPGRTLELVLAFKREFPQSHLRLVAGLDIYFERTRWYHFEEVETVAPPLYVKRTGQPEVPGLAMLEAPPDISSSTIRCSLQSRSPIDPALLDPAIYSYIQQHRLYEE